MKNMNVTIPAGTKTVTLNVERSNTPQYTLRTLLQNTHGYVIARFNDNGLIWEISECTGTYNEAGYRLLTRIEQSKVPGVSNLLDKPATITPLQAGCTLTNGSVVIDREPAVIFTVTL